MIICTAESVAGYRTVETLGLVQGSCIKSKHLGKDIGAGLKSGRGELRVIVSYWKNPGRSYQQNIEPTVWGQMP